MSKKVLGYFAVAFVVFLVLKNPLNAATTAGHLGNWLADAATSVGTFFTALTGGGGQ